MLPSFGDAELPAVAGELAGHRDDHDAAALAALDDAKEQPLASISVAGVPEDVRASVREAGEDASVGAFRVGIGISTALVALGGLLGLAGIRNPRRQVDASDCPGGQLVGHPREATRQSPCDWGDQARPQEAPV